MSDRMFFLVLLPTAVLSMLMGLWWGGYRPSEAPAAAAPPTRTHGLLAQPKLSYTNDYPEKGVTVTCEAFANRKLNFKVGAQPGDTVATFCTATKFRKEPVG